PVASMVRFVDGKPNKAGYRHFNIKTVVGPDDFASMNEIVRRRYQRLQDEGSELPDLIVIDGGKGQLHSACDALRNLGLYGQIPIVGIAKKLEEIYFPGDQLPLHLSKKSQGLMLLQQIRDEAHRFAITFHRQKRSTSSLQTAMNEIPGIGSATIDKLLKTYKSWKKIKELPFDELVTQVGESKAHKILEAIKKEA
ncbi:MAG: excinuclease ABC subunit C, partial [Cyclobacteriaceae bacterium]